MSRGAVRDGRGKGGKNRERAERKKQRRQAGQWLPPFAGVDDGEPLWRHFWMVMAAAAALRLLAAITGDWLMRTDELFQYLEQAHRVVFGYGQIPWEFRFGMRSWLLPAMSVPPLWFAKTLGFDSPDSYAPIVRSFHALLSLAVPAGMYLFTRRFHGEYAARAALVFGCFWHELVVLSPHPSAENAATTFAFAALILMTRSPGIFRRALIGFLLGMVVASRIQYAPVAGVIGLMLLFRPTWQANAAMIGGGIAALVVAGAVDYRTWGAWWESYINYFNLQFSGYGEYTNKPDPAVHIKSMLVASAGLFYIAMFSALFSFRRLWAAAALTLAVMIPHNIFPNEYTNIYLGVPFLLMVCACVVAEWLARPQSKKRGEDDLEILPPRKKAAWFSAAMLAVSVLAFFGWLPNQTHMYVFKNERPLFYESEFFKINKSFSRMPSQEVKSVVFLIPGGSAHLFGGYYYTHQNAPLWFPFTDDHDRDALGIAGEDLQNLQEFFGGVSGRFANTASHLVMPRGAAAEGFTPVYETPGIVVWQNNNIAAVTAPPGAVYDIMDNAIVGVLGILDEDRLGVISQKDKPLAPIRY